MKSFVTSSGIAGDVTGDGPAILLIAGLSGRGAFWHGVMHALAGKFRTVTFDHPGVGASRDLDVQSIPNIAAAGLEALDAIGIECAAIVGHSTGSLAAQTIALDVPQRCNRLVLSGGWARADARLRDCFALRKQLLLKAGSEAYGAFVELFGYPNTYYNACIAKDHRPAFDDTVNADADTVVSRIDMLLGYSRQEELPRLAARTMIVGARDDMVVPFEHCGHLASMIPGAELVEMTGGHFFPKIATQEYARNLISFMERT